MRNRPPLQPELFVIESKQDELDLIEQKILVKLFGKTCIPEKTGKLLNILNINPNSIINNFESKLRPLMNDDGRINGKTIKQVLSLTKYKDLCSIITIPDEDFLPSDYFDSLLNIFIPGGKINV